MALRTLLTLEVAAAYLGRTPEWLATEARTGRIAGRKAGREWRFYEDDIEAYLEVHGAAQPRVRRRRAS